MRRQPTQRRSGPGPRLRRALGPVLALVLLAAPAAACPYCALSQGTDTLIYIMAFLAIPYVIVAGTWYFLKRLLAEEQLELRREAEAAAKSNPASAA